MVKIDDLLTRIILVKKHHHLPILKCQSMADSGEEEKNRWEKVWIGSLLHGGGN